MRHVLCTLLHHILAERRRAGSDLPQRRQVVLLHRQQHLLQFKLHHRNHRVPSPKLRVRHHREPKYMKHRQETGSPYRSWSAGTISEAAMKFLCVRITPLLVPDEYISAAVSVCFTVLSGNSHSMLDISISSVQSNAKSSNSAFLQNS